MNYTDFLKTARIDQQQYVLIYSYQKWNELMRNRSSDFSSACLIATAARNITANGFLYEFLMKSDIESITIDGKDMIAIFVNGDLMHLREEISRITKAYESKVILHNYNRFQDQMACDFMLAEQMDQ